jgi:hypothetical protein
VRRSRTSIATASSIGASARSEISSNLPRWNLLDRLEHRARLLADGEQTAVDRVVVTGHAQRDRVGMAAHDRGFRCCELTRRLGQPRLAADHARPIGGEGDFEFRLTRDGAQAAGDGALERLGRRFLRGGLGFDVGRHHNALVIQKRR